MGPGGQGGDHGGSISPQAYLNADARTGVADNGKISYTIDQAATQLDRADDTWGGQMGQAAVVTYAYRADPPLSMPDDTAGFTPFNTAQITQAELALKAWSDVANITFVRVGSGTSGAAAYSDNATILLGNYSSGEAGASAFTYFPGSRSSLSAAGDVWVNSTYSYNSAPAVGNYGGMVLVHELGHAIGLSHPSDYNASANVTLTYATDASYYEDSRQYTVMSYFAGANTGANLPGYSAAPLLDDIAAAQQLYGANMNTRTGDTIYGFHSNADEPWFQLTSNSSPAQFAVWDAGGNNTFDFSGYSANQNIDLRQGFFSDVGGYTGNVAIAQGTNIQNAIGGTGADSITGNDLNNSLAGGAGDDLLIGGAGNDTLDGGSGTNAAAYSGLAQYYTITPDSHGFWTVADTRPGSPDGSDTLISIQVLHFTDTTIDLPDPQVAIELAAVLRMNPLSGPGAALAADLTAQLTAGTATIPTLPVLILQDAAGTTSVATLSYEFFTGRAPTAAGMDFLVSPEGPNPNNLNSAYYQGFSLDNRYINFAVNLGKYGAGATTFATTYGNLNLFDATREAYLTIFGSTPSDAKLHQLLDPTLTFNGLSMTRADYFAYYGQDGPNGVGAKAAMVGWLLAEAVKADVGTYALSNDAFLTDVALHNAPFGVDLVGVYDKPAFAYLST